MSNDPAALEANESADLWYVPHLDDLQLLRAHIVSYAFKRHAHDYFVIGMIENGVQQFAYRRDRFVTPPTGLIVINPGEPDTGEAAIATGFDYRALYPAVTVLQQVASELKGRYDDIPFFSTPVINDPDLYREMRFLHHALTRPGSSLEHETRYRWALGRLVVRHADTCFTPQRIGAERTEIARVCGYIEEYFADDIRLDDLAALVHWNPFYLLRVFRNATGLPPHAYLESVRVRRAQELLKQGLSLATVSYDTGFSSQSHFTTTFKRIIGVTPGHYQKQVNIVKDEGVVQR